MKKLLLITAFLGTQTEAYFPKLSVGQVIKVILPTVVLGTGAHYLTVLIAEPLFQQLDQEIVNSPTLSEHFKKDYIKYLPYIHQIRMIFTNLSLSIGSLLCLRSLLEAALNK